MDCFFETSVEVTITDSKIYMAPIPLTHCLQHLMPLVSILLWVMFGYLFLSHHGYPRSTATASSSTSHKYGLVVIILSNEMIYMMLLKFMFA